MHRYTILHGIRHCSQSGLELLSVHETDFQIGMTNHLFEKRVSQTIFNLINYPCLGHGGGHLFQKSQMFIRVQFLIAKDATNFFARRPLYRRFPSNRLFRFHEFSFEQMEMNRWFKLARNSLLIHFLATKKPPDKSDWLKE